MNTRIIVVIVVLVVIVLCCLGSTISGVLQDRNAERGKTSESDWSPDWLASLDELVARDLDPDDVVGSTPNNCRAGFRGGNLLLAVGETCALRIGESAWPARVLTLRLMRGQQAPLVLDPRGDELPTKVTLGRSDEEELRIFKEGATLTLGCLDAGTDSACRFTVR